jgi:tRNA threonylcarbamoyl adenosine modification protein YeaZ
MLALAIHTSSPQLGLMLKTTEQSDAAESVERYQVWDLGREVSSQLHVKLMEFIAPYRWQDLSFVAVDKGPGSFTGTRIGVVVARTLAQQLSIPLFGVSALASLAARSCAQLPLSENQDIAVTLPAQRGAVYGAIYRPDTKAGLVSVRNESALSQAEWAEILIQWDRPLREVKTEIGSGIADSVTGTMALALAQWEMGKRPDWSSVMPFYGQHPVDR